VRCTGFATEFSSVSNDDWRLDASRVEGLKLNLRFSERPVIDDTRAPSGGVHGTKLGLRDRDADFVVRRPRSKENEGEGENVNDGLCSSSSSQTIVVS